MTARFAEDRYAEIRERLRQFTADRGWDQFHDPKNLAMAVASEAGELLAELRWIATDVADAFARDPENRSRMESEAADTAIALISFCDRIGIDLLEAVDRKITINERNYPVALSHGKPNRPPESDRHAEE